MLAEVALEEQVGRRFAEHGRTLATAESCSGGLIAHRITNVSGSSGYFLGGVVSYSNEVKSAFLGVNAVDIAAQGAVSETVARQMAEGARECFHAAYGIGVTGIAGPTGGTAGKPVGLVYIAVAGPAHTRAVRHVFSGSREDVKRQTADTALAMLLECLE